MARIDKTYLDLPGLQTYNARIKALIPEADESTITLDDDNKLSLINVPTVEGEVLKLS